MSSTVSIRWSAAGTPAGNDDRLDGVAALVRWVRRESLNRGIGALVGGRIFAEKPELARPWAPTRPPRTAAKRRCRRKPC